jgi:ketose-bisphosphate aldolase
MPFIPMKPLLKHALANGYAVPSFCAWNADIMRTVLDTAQELAAPVILMNGPPEFELLDPFDTSAAASALLARRRVRAALLLDHGDSVERAQTCIEAGYTSVMLDLSARPFEENVAGLKRTVEIARGGGVTVEGEIGHVGRVGAGTEEGEGSSSLTEPGEAAEYARQTGVDALAISIGNAHGNYTALPRFDFERLAAIREKVKVPLVLHGGTGTPQEDLRKAISLGIAKVNVASALVHGMRESLMGQWQVGRNTWAPVAQAEALTPVRNAVAEWIRKLGAEGKAE